GQQVRGGRSRRHQLGLRVGGGAGIVDCGHRLGRNRDGDVGGGGRCVAVVVRGGVAEAVGERADRLVLDIGDGARVVGVAAVVIEIGRAASRERGGVSDGGAG